MSKTKNITLSAFFLALGLIMPFITGQIPAIASMLLPMHIPILLCGFVLGAPYGACVGFITPLLRSVLFQMPPILSAVTMAFELAAYGFCTGFLYKRSDKTTIHIYISLTLSMIAGRIIWGIASMILYGIGGSGFTLAAFIAGAFTNAIPGIILQLILIPILVKVLEKANLLHS